MPRGGRALAVQRPQLPVLGRRAAVRLPARPLRAALAARGPGSCWSPPSGSPTSRLAQRPAGRAAHARPERPRGAARRAAARRRAASSRREIQKVDGSAAPARRGARRGGRGARARPAAADRVSAPLRAARQPGLGRRAGAEGAPGRARELDRAAARTTARSPRAASSTPHEEAARGRRGGRDRRRARRRRPARARSPARCKGTGSALAIDPVRPRQRPRARARHPHRPGRGRAARRRRARSGCSTWRTSTARRSWASPASASTPTPTGSPTRRSSSRATLVYLYAALRALAAWKPAHFSVIVDGERHELTGCTVAVGNSKAYGGGMYVAARGRARRRPARRACSSKDASKLPLPARLLPKVFKGTHGDSPLRRSSSAARRSR